METKILADKLVELKREVVELESYIDINVLKNNVSEIEHAFTEEGFWDNHSRANELTAKLSSYKHKYDLYTQCGELLAEIELAVDLLEDSYEQDLYVETEGLINELSEKLASFKNILLLNGKFDNNNAVMEIHAGAGGTEAQDWVEMLYRMYTRYFDKSNFKVKVLHYHAGDPIGIKSISFEVEGRDAYGYLKGERGVHRLIRISPFDSSGKRHTSFASVHIVPIISEVDDIIIEKSDLKIDTFRASGAGGQSVNTTDSAVRITHLPTGIVVSCQNERSQLHNKEYAMNLLKNKLVARREEERQKLIQSDSGDKSENGWGSQIRSYVFHPYSMVKDHRTNYESGNVKAILDGDIDEFIIKFLEHINT